MIFHSWSMLYMYNMVRIWVVTPRCWHVLRMYEQRHRFMTTNISPSVWKLPAKLGVDSCLATNSTDRLSQCKCNPMHFVTSSISHTKRCHKNEDQTIWSKETCPIDVTRKHPWTCLFGWYLLELFAPQIEIQEPPTISGRLEMIISSLITISIWKKFLETIYSIDFRSSIQFKPTGVKIKTSQWWNSLDV